MTSSAVPLTHWRPPYRDCVTLRLSVAEAVLLYAFTDLIWSLTRGTRVTLGPAEPGVWMSAGGAHRVVDSASFKLYTALRDARRGGL